MSTTSMNESQPSSSSVTTPLQPSLFDLLAAESLLQTTRPALKKLIQSLASLPGGGGGGGGGGEFGRWLRRWGDEVTLFLELCLHYYFLRKHGASFAENFYGLRRAVAGDGTTNASLNSGLSRAAAFKSLVLVVLLPYARKKLAEVYERLSQMKEDGELDSVKGRRLIEAFLAAYPLLAVCSQSSTLAYQLLYACGKSKFHDSFQHLFGGFYLTYAPPPLPPSASSSSSSSSDSLVKSTLNGLFRISSRLLGHSFSVGLFFVQFFDVFDVEGRGGGREEGSDSSFSSSMMDEYSHRIFKRLDAIIAPPKMAFRAAPNGQSPFSHNLRTVTTSGATSSNFFSDGFSLLSNPLGNSFSSSSSSSFAAIGVPSSVSFDTAAPHHSHNNNNNDNNDNIDGDDCGGDGVLRRCPICGGRRRDETALSVSGFVFCHDCISSYLKQNGCCPVTKLPAKTSNLVRLYPGY